MNKITLAVVAIATSFSVSAFAQQDVKNDIRNLLFEIGSQLNNTTADQKSLVSARNQLQNALDLVKNQRRPDRPDRRDADLTCVSRDNDGREPYQLAVRDTRDFSVIKVPGAVLTLAQCQEVQSSARTAGSTVILCASRDGDSRDPYAIFSFDTDTRQSAKLTAVGSFNDCTTTLGYVLASRTHVAYCAARDGDGRSPYVRFSYELATKKSTPAGQVYNTLNECNQAN